MWSVRISAMVWPGIAGPHRQPRAINTDPLGYHVLVTCMPEHGRFRDDILRRSIAAELPSIDIGICQGNVPVGNSCIHKRTACRCGHAHSVGVLNSRWEKLLPSTTNKMLTPVEHILAPSSPSPTAVRRISKAPSPRRMCPGVLNAPAYQPLQRAKQVVI